MTEILRLTDADALADLGSYAARARRLDPEGAMRLQAVGEVLAAWVCARPGHGISHEGIILALRTLALAEPATLDRCVPLGAITDRTERHAASGGGAADLPVPPTEVHPAWAALTPPRGGWMPLGTVPADGLVQLARGDRERLAVQPDDAGLGSAGAQSAGGAGGIPAILTGPVGVTTVELGFLAPGAEIAVHRSGAWIRLSAPGGYVLIR